MEFPHQQRRSCTTTTKTETTAAQTDVGEFITDLDGGSRKAERAARAVEPSLKRRAARLRKGSR